ncbi:hypothetical protein HUJ04_006210 [Dendroctonus ponderosae]|uniref:Uncharacterized protein n=1 Tax=Dendroctonus ponderosae TaxID=77166 RepID=A0AAR5Q8C9_DENPD|nr:hypothetical protein HUJ04_006210 [Dendroctonus ponderosae]
MFESDDDDFTLSPSSKLSEMFNAPVGADTTLSYKAPKQPRPPEAPKSNEPAAKIETPTGPPSSPSSVILATPVILWKLENGSNIPMGNYMLAIIGHQAKGVFEIILYQKTTIILVREILGSSVVFYKYPKQFVAFYDRVQQLWNMNFDKKDNLDNFLQHATKYNSRIVDKAEESHLGESKNAKNSPNVEAEATEPSSKQKLLSKITNYGQQVLPKAPQRTNRSDLSDSETESSSSERNLAKPAIAPRKLKKAPTNCGKSVASQHENALSLTSQNLANNNYFLPTTQLVPNTHSRTVYSTPLPDYSLSNFIVAQNAELKANLAEISAKLNSLTCSGNDNGPNLNDQSTLRTKIKCQSLKIDNLSSDLERSRTDLERTQMRLDEALEELAKASMYRAQVDLAELQEKALEVENLKEQLARKDEQLATCRSKIEELELANQGSEQRRGELSRECSELKESLDERAREVEELKRQYVGNVSLKKGQVEVAVKQALSDAFENVMEEVGRNESYDFNSMHGALSKNLKKTGFNLINFLLQDPSASGPS